MKDYLRSILLFSILLFSFVSCDDFLKTTITVNFDYNKFKVEKSAWENSNQLNYQYNLSSIDGGEYVPINTLIIVENGQFKEQIPLTEYGDAEENYQTIDNIYETIENIYRRYNNTQQSKKDYYLTRIKIEYDLNHIPLKIEYYYYVPQNIMDMGEYWPYEIKNYKNNS
jgi:hypothetical protein